MTYTDETVSGELGATRQTWRPKSIRDLLAEIVAGHPRDSDKELFGRFVEHLRDDEDYFLAVAEYAFVNTLRALRKQKPTAAQTAAAARKRAARVAAHAKLVSRIKAKALLSLKMPNNKQLRQCTGAECQHFGGWYERIAERVGPTKLVGDVLTEKDVRALYREV